MATRPITPPTDAEVARLVVLGALCRGMTVSYAARTAGITKPEVAAIAAAAGWPDIPAVKAVHEALRAAKSKSGPKRHRRPATAVVPLVPDGDHLVVDATPLPNPSPLLGLLAHFGVDVEGKTITVAGQPVDEAPPGLGLDELRDIAVGALDELSPATDSPTPAPVKRSATRPGTLPCEGCGRGVTREYVAATGIQRHGHCREGA